MGKLSREQMQRRMKAAFAVLEKTLQREDDYLDFMVILPYDPKMLSRIFTEERLRLWAELHRSKSRSLTQLAKRLGRNVSRVRQDVLILESAHMATLTKVGTQVRAVAQAPHIMIAPPV
jgi:predicted transcriptional regulator